MSLLFLKISWRKCVASQFFFFLTCLCTIILTNISAQEPETALNIHNHGGLLKNWLIMGPFFLPQSTDSMQNASEEAIDRIIASLDFDFLAELGGEDSVIILKKSAVPDTENDTVRYKRAKEFEAGANGIVSLDSLFTSESLGVVYAFCLVEAYIPCKVRCVWGVDGSSKVWVNGNIRYNTWDYVDSCLPLSKYFDAEFVQGMNRLLIKLTNEKEHSRFCFETWDLRDSLKPYIRNIHSLRLELKGNEIKSDKDSITACLRFNIPTAEHFFNGCIEIYPDPNKALSRKKITSYEVNVGKQFTIGIPADRGGVIGINATAVVKENRVMQTTRYIWSGNFTASFESEHKRFALLGQEVGRYEGDNALVKAIVYGAYQWVRDWFEIADSLTGDQKIRQLGYVQSNGYVIESLIKGKRVHGDFFIPMYLPPDIKHDNKGPQEYDPSQWLNYKYPEIFAMPKDIQGASDYRFWMYLPKSAQKKRKKMPLILSLHDIDVCGFDIDKARRFGPAAYAGSISRFPFAVITPQCRYNTLWDAKALKTLLDKLIATGRFDKNRVSITGMGMGAFASLYLPSIYPDMFIAAAPINGGGEWDNICNLKNVSIWLFHGEKDTIVPVEKSQEVISLLKECGKKNVELSVYTEYGHDLSSIVYNDVKLYKWLKMRKR